MVKEQKLREMLIVLTTHCKTFHDTLSLIMEEVSALRDTVRALDPTFEDNFQVRKADISASQLRQQAQQQYDAIIRRLEEGEVC